MAIGNYGGSSRFRAHEVFQPVQDFCLECKGNELRRAIVVLGKIPLIDAKLADQVKPLF